jgi:hypothetical protein
MLMSWHLAMKTCLRREWWLTSLAAGGGGGEEILSQVSSAGSRSRIVGSGVRTKPSER